MKTFDELAVLDRFWAYGREWVKVSLVSAYWSDVPPPSVTSTFEKKDKVYDSQEEDPVKEVQSFVFMGYDYHTVDVYLQQTSEFFDRTGISI